MVPKDTIIMLKQFISIGQFFNTNFLLKIKNYNLITNNTIQLY